MRRGKGDANVSLATLFKKALCKLYSRRDMALDDLIVPFGRHSFSAHQTLKGGSHSEAAAGTVSTVGVSCASRACEAERFVDRNMYAAMTVPALILTARPYAQAGPDPGGP